MSKGMNIATWIIQIAVAGLFVMMSISKLTEDPETVANFKHWEMSDFMMYIGILELLGAIGLLIPRLAGLAAIGLFGLMIGAFVTHIRFGEMMAILPAVVMVLLAIVVYARNPLKALGGKTEGVNQA